jgi:hypothetical protein
MVDFKSCEKMPAEGLLGFASPLRDRRRKASGVQLGLTAKFSNPSCFMSGVRPRCLFAPECCTYIFLKSMPAEGLLACASSLRDRRRKASGVQLGLAAKLSNPSCFMSGFEMHAGDRWILGDID